MFPDGVFMGTSVLTPVAFVVIVDHTEEISMPFSG